MRAAQVIDTTGPDDVVVAELPEPTPGPGDVLIDVHSVGVSFPDLLLSRGQYQVRPELPFALGTDVAGVVVSAPEGSGLVEGQRVVSIAGYGGAAERFVAPAAMVLPLPDRLSYDEGAALPMNYLTAHFALRKRAGLEAGETVLVHGAAGGVGTATIQVAKAYGATSVAVVSTDEKGEVARAAGADHVVLLDGFKDAVAEITGGRGVDVVVDVVGGDVFLDSLRSLAPLGRLLVIGFASGQGIPEVKVNRLLLTNTDVRGVGWGEHVRRNPGYPAEQWADLLPHLESGALRPPVGASYALEEFPQALRDLDERRALGKIVVRVRG
ncbi:NADPH:quinone oxidoreductase family protein [Nocardioides alkalitolerans]|uniref:NADPH:quinone oxidoreductase family protein n=1 Tax=Nocardioides alkalitolerans TaxID=281714 RepID=UPI0004086097|nr:NADPH:quinone oxidoreductase family protein [Nocardioides alkalitolerans]